MKKRIILLVLIILIMSAGSVFASDVSSFSKKNVNGISINAVELDMKSNRIKPVILNANNQMLSTESLASMAKKQGAFAAINGTYFSAYEGLPFPWGTIIKDGKIIHISNKNPVVGIKDSGELIIDRLSFELAAYVNGVQGAWPWRINHPSTEAEAVTIYTPEYGTTVTLQTGAKAVLVSEGYVSQITTSSFTVPSKGFAIVFNSGATRFADNYQIGDQADYDIRIKTTFTDPSQWEDVTSGLGAGPSLIINGVITADGHAENFSEPKINTNRAGRNLNNGLGFVKVKELTKIAKPTTSQVLLNGTNVDLDAYNIDGNNYFKLRDIAMILNNTNRNFNIVWDGNNNAINLNINEKYIPVGGELNVSRIKTNKTPMKTDSNIFIDGNKAELKAYNIDNNNYFKLRDVLDYLDIEVIWDSSTNSILINTN